MITVEEIKKICGIYDSAKRERDAATIAYNSEDTFWEHVLTMYKFSRPAEQDYDVDKAAEDYAWQKEEPLAEGERLSTHFNSHIEDFKAGAQWRDAQIPKLPDSLDKAAIQAHARLEDGEGLSFLNIFKAGADWMASQGVVSEGKVFTSSFTSYVKTPGIEKLLKDAFPEDTEVIVQVRKKIK